MVAFYKELQPIDSYKIIMAHPFSDYDRQLLTLFYQPLIGSNAMSLFMTLWADAEQTKEREYNHYHLMNVLTNPLATIFEARISLEAIGLLRTHARKEVDTRSFLYELLPPLDAKSFFEDALLSTFLFSKIGEQAYRNLRNRFVLSIDEMASYNEVSRTFLDVYKPVNVGNTNNVTIQNAEVIGRQKSEGIDFVDSAFDFDLLRSGLSEQMVPQSALSKVPREMIAKLAFLYSLTPLDMQKVIMMALDEDLELPEARLRRAAADFYKMSVSKEAPVLEKAFAQQPLSTEQKKELTREEQLLHNLENTAPVDMLRQLNNKEPMPVDVQLAERLVNTHDLPVGVVNVLLQYVHIRNDGKITNNYVERIASHWMNKKVETAKQAMDLSREEHDKYMQWKNEGQKAPAYKGKPTREEMVPEWFYKKDDEKPKQKQTKKKDKDMEERRRKLREELQEMSKGVK